MKTKKKRISGFNAVLFCVLTIYTLSMIILFLWGVFTSLKTRSEFRHNKLLWPMETWAFDNFKYVWQNFSVTRTVVGQGKVVIDINYQILYSVIYAIGSAFVTTVAHCVVAYLTEKFPYKFSKIVYTFAIITMVIPIIGSQAAMMEFLTRTGMFDTWVGNFMMKFSFLGTYYLVFCAIFKSISPAYAEAAMIDGASEMQIFVQIMIPLIMPTFNTIFLIKFIEYWNDYQTVLLYLPTHPTLSYGVFYMSVNNLNGLSSEPMRLASCMILCIPLLILFIALQNKIMGNVTMGGVKE